MKAKFNFLHIFITFLKKSSLKCFSPIFAAVSKIIFCFNFGPLFSLGGDLARCDQVRELDKYTYLKSLGHADNG